jgi:hypothetical protein
MAKQRKYLPVTSDWKQKIEAQNQSTNCGRQVMGDWKQKIEAQIHRLIGRDHRVEAYTMQALLDVAVAADIEWTVHGLRENSDLLAAVRKLREAGDG